MKTMKWLVTVLLLAAASVQAKQVCDLELHGGLRITATALEFTDGDKPLYKIIKDQDLWVGDRRLVLNASQQQLVKQYSTSIRSLVPEVREISVEGVALAADAMRLVFQELLDPDNETVKRIDREFSLLKSDIENSLANGSSISINQKGISDGDYLGMNFEKRVTNIVEASGKEISWNLIKSLGSAIFSDDDKRGDFEVRMNRLNEKMERSMAKRSEHLDKRGEAICHSVVLLDIKEEELKKSIKEISQFDVILLKNTASKQAK